MRQYWFPIRKREIFRPGQEIKGLRGGVRGYVAQASPQIDAARAEKGRFRMVTSYSIVQERGKDEICKCVTGYGAFLLPFGA